MARRVHARLALSPAAAAAARRLLEPVRQHLDAESFDCLRLLVSELVNNSVKHSGRPAGDPIELTVEVDANSARAQVADRGAGLARRPDGPDPETLSGWGLYLVDRLADQWGYTAEAPTRVWFEMVLRQKGDLRGKSHPLGGFQTDRIA